ncbi:MOSC domain-containing protein [Pseudomonas sp. NPDC087804]|uniref:MOSC domain-containing protein n=1 Tax=Pseudomonas sp. NPDC087804 TaxID=3364449 RepID=UPI00380C56B8
MGDVIIDHIFAGGITVLKPEGQSTGIYKKKLSSGAFVNLNGVVGDQQADRRVHGGPEKAIHHYAAENYSLLAAEFPSSVESLVAGSLGENISTRGMNEKNVFIGDTYQVGSCLIQVSQPRSPCWKINHRFGEEKMSMFVVQGHLTGWYYRVLREGSFDVGDTMRLLNRETEEYSIDRFWQIQLSHRPELDDLIRLSMTTGLAQDWCQRLSGRAEWLRKKYAP